MDKKKGFTLAFFKCHDNELRYGKDSHNNISDIVSLLKTPLLKIKSKRL